MSTNETAQSIGFERLSIDTGDGVNVGYVDLDGTEVVSRKDAVRPAALAGDVQIHVNTVGVLHISRGTVGSCEPELSFINMTMIMTK